VPASLLHLVRHGEVHNPDGVLYGRIPGFRLSELGRKMADSAVDALKGHDVVKLYASPLQRAQESAEPWAERFGLEVHTEERLIEPHNRFEGKKFEFGPQVLANPASWPWVTNPMRPSWGEPFVSIAARMLHVLDDAWKSVDYGEVVLVSHQLPIWMVHRSVAGKRLYHDPRRRRCNLSSVTSFARDENAPTGFVETGYRDAAQELLIAAIDQGAV
jgi:broad specificity phosphatase PhoE